MRPWPACLALLLCTTAGQPQAPDARADAAKRAVADLLAGRFQWKTSPPLLAPVVRLGDPCVSVKDPSVVFFAGKWHLFCTIRSKKKTHQIEYLSFADWKDAARAPRHILNFRDGYCCAPQVFYFTSQKKWYLICQVADPARKPALQPACSTTTNLADPRSWSAPVLLFDRQPAEVGRWIDFWVICDERKAHLFFTSLDGRMWRAETGLVNFPRGWSAPKVVLKADLFEASHTYRLKDLNRYLTLVEAQDGGRRYYQAYLADRLDGAWKPLATTRERPFAGRANVRHQGDRWTDSISHGELLRVGHDERLEVDPGRLRFLFQGVSDRERAGKKYGEIPWRLGILEPDRGS